MVRLLLLSTLFLSSAIAVAHDASATVVRACEMELNPAQIRTYDFLKKLQAEEDAKFPADKFVRVAAGRAIGPFAAAMQQAGSQIASLPLEMNLTGIVGGKTKDDLWQLFRTYLPTYGLDGKNIVVFVYSETSLPVIALQASLMEYLAHNKIPADGLQIRVLTSQMVVRELDAKLELGMFKDEYSLRPMAAANEVRHWFHDGLRPGKFDTAQFRIIDIYGDLGDITFKASERPAFTALKQSLQMNRVR